MSPPLRLLLLLLLPAASLSCQTPSTHLPTGLSTEYAGYVPARIAVLKCRVWPSSASFAEIGLSNVDNNTITNLCAKFDDYVVAGFKDQPYMRGFSPAAVEKLLAAASKEQFDDGLFKHWGFAADSCLNCINPQSFYASTVAKRSSWRAALQEFSAGVRFSDAVLMPFVMFASEKIYMDRGVRVHQRNAAIALLLVDTANGFLLWSGGREANGSTQEFPQSGSSVDAKFPPWDIVNERLFIEDVWKDFPGRQVYR